MNKEQVQAFTKRISGGNRSEIIVVLFDIFMVYEQDARKALLEIQQARAEQNYEQKVSATKAYREGIRHASMVLRHLEDDLNFDQEISNQLFRLYTYCERALARATYKEDPEIFDRVEKVMGELREAFVAVAAEDTSAPLMANTQKYVAGYTYGRTDVKEMAVNFDISRGFLA
ncbi:MAG: flagellar protein FliS [Lachnospiraceae bacterium]|jgi:flagellar protein FliS|nr:flagellar protein FliS [Lachnospiraceae bacterium]MBQ2503031.1 flagellar protein FliS [Lachnospiraceae bacterium]MBQ2577841.1 flagellar protein FliS [Lachnospiraceae bacterium]MBQ5386874.1 flagellar protein FliS [Lachnospiraceae bacterium]